MFLDTSLLSDHHEMFVSVTSSASLEITPAGCTHDPTHDTGGEFKYSGGAGQEIHKKEKCLEDVFILYHLCGGGEADWWYLFSCHMQRARYKVQGQV